MHVIRFEGDELKNVEYICDRCKAITSWNECERPQLVHWDYVSDWEQITIPVKFGGVTSLTTIDLCPECYEKYKEQRLEKKTNDEIVEWIKSGF